MRFDTENSLGKVHSDGKNSLEKVQSGTENSLEKVLTYGFKSNKIEADRGEFYVQTKNNG